MVYAERRRKSIPETGRLYKYDNNRLLYCSLLCTECVEVARRTILADLVLSGKVSSLFFWRSWLSGKSDLVLHQVY